MMRIFYSFIITIFFCYHTTAQQVVVAADANLSLATGVSFSSNGLIFTPSATFNMSGLSVQQNTTVTNSFGNPYVSRVYYFGAVPPVFSGDIQFEYDDGELNGLDESLLQLIVYNGSSWQVAGTSSNDATNNYVMATGLTNQTLGEMMLASGLGLPLKWGAVSASRQNELVKIKWNTEQEFNVSHFDVERSTDGINWIIAIARIAAGNHSYKQQYEQTDKPNHTEKLYYRIRQTDIDGRYTLSNVVNVAAEKNTSLLSINPNPINGYFVISGAEAAKVSKVNLFNNSGVLIKYWNAKQVQYNLPSLPAGIYYVCIQTMNGEVVNKQVLVR